MGGIISRWRCPWQRYWSGLPFPSPADHVLSELSAMTCPSWVALHGIAHSFIELRKPLRHDKAAKPSTVEVLEKIDKDIQALEEFREKNQRQQKLWVGRFLLYSSLLYLVSCLIIYLWYLPDEWTARFIMTLPLFAFPLIVWSIRTLLIFVFSKRTERNNEALEDLKLQKKKILEEVMEKETYKAAKLILERFDPEAKKAKDVEPPSAGASAVPGPGQDPKMKQLHNSSKSLHTPTMATAPPLPTTYILCQFSTRTSSSDPGERECVCTYPSYTQAGISKNVKSSATISWPTERDFGAWWTSRENCYISLTAKHFAKTSWIPCYFNAWNGHTLTADSYQDIS
ncbi:Endoplasmic reticulum junction formation protein lunapark, partial [Varanus komodoensis]